jgi:hypothetical protein
VPSDIVLAFLAVAFLVAAVFRRWRRFWAGGRRAAADVG